MREFVLTYRTVSEREREGVGEREYFTCVGRTKCDQIRRNFATLEKSPKSLSNILRVYLVYVKIMKLLW